MPLIYFLAGQASAAVPVTAPPPPPRPTIVIAPPPSPPLPPIDIDPPVPLGNPGDWVTSNDYPSEALRSDTEGTTGFRANVDYLGVVTNCVVTSSSGSPVLDEATCKLVKLRARFQPARNKKGQAIAGTYSNRIRWQIPTDMSLPESGAVVRTFIVETDGSMSHCLVERVDGPFTARVQVGEFPCSKRSFDRAFLDINGRPTRKLVRVTEAVSVDEVPLEAPDAPGGKMKDVPKP